MSTSLPSKVVQAVSKLHLRTYCTRQAGQNGTSDKLITEFCTGPFRFVVIMNVPDRQKQSAPAYAKIEFVTDPQWWANPVPPSHHQDPSEEG